MPLFLFRPITFYCINPKPLQVVDIQLLLIQCIKIIKFFLN